MTCIIGLVHKDRVYMGGDSMAAASWDMQAVRHPKVFKTGEFIIGYTDSFRMGQLLQYEFAPPGHDSLTPRAYMTSVFPEAVRKLFADKGYLWVENSRESGGEFIVGYRGALYTVQSDFSVLQYREAFTAVGCGKPYALGAMACMEALSPKRRIRQALQIAAQFSNGVCAPFYVEVLKHGNK